MSTIADGENMALTYLEIMRQELTMGPVDNTYVTGIDVAEPPYPKVVLTVMPHCADIWEMAADRAKDDDGVVEVFEPYELVYVAASAALPVTKEFITDLDNNYVNAGKGPLRSCRVNERYLLTDGVVDFMFSPERLNVDDVTVN